MDKLKHYKLLFVILLLLFTAPSSASSFDDSEIMHIDYPNWFNENAFNDLAEMTKTSIDKGKKGLFVLFTTEGCSYCERFIKESLGEPNIASIMQKNFGSVGFEIFDDTEMQTPNGSTMSIKEFSAKENVQFSPTLLFYGENGKRILRLTGYQSPQKFKKALDYVINNHYKKVTFKNYLLSKVNPKLALNKNNTSAHLIKNRLFKKPPYMLDRSHFPASTPLIVIFEKTDCKACETFHSETLAKKDVLKTLINFDVVRLDIKDDKTKVMTPNGLKTTPAQWYESSSFTQVPALMIFDEGGNQVLMSDALILRQRMMNSLNYTLEKAYKKNWSYQQFARSKGIERSQNKNNNLNQANKQRF